MNKNFIITDKDLKLINEEINCYKNSRSACIGVLKIIQSSYGWINDEAIRFVSSILHISKSDVESIATFYSQIFRKPVGKNIIFYCDSIVCYICGYLKIKKFLEKTLNIFSGETTKDKLFTLLPICCLGYCDKSPILMINEDSFFNIKTKHIVKILKKYK